MRKPLDLASYPELMTKLDLPNSNNDYLGKSVTISGYGRTDPDNKKISKDLKYAPAYVINNKDCQRDREDKTIYPAEHLCTKVYQRNDNRPEGVCKVKLYDLFFL